MTILTYALITLGVFVAMEGITWCTHKYVMHGFMWYFHEDHHQPGYPHVFERNDAFFVIFAIPSITLFYLGSVDGINFMFFIGLGILMYGMAYFFVHDILIHQRLKWIKKTNNFFVFGETQSRFHHCVVSH